MGKLSIVIAIVLIGIVGCAGRRPLPAATPTAPVTVAPPAEASLRAYLADNFGDMDWYPLVRDFSLSTTGIDIATSLTASDPSPAHAICGAVSGWASHRPDLASGSPVVAVRAADGTVLVIRRGPSERC